MTKEDYMRLPKERLAELLVEMEEKFLQPITIPNMPAIPTTPHGWICDVTHCTNPFHDCINCPIKTTGGITSTNSTSHEIH